MNGSGEDAKAQLLRLKDLTRRTGVVVEAQVLQLKHYPFVPWMPKEVALDVQAAPLYQVTYHITPKKPAEFQGKKFRQNCERLTAWVQTLLGEEWRVVVKVRSKNGKKKARADYVGAAKAKVEHAEVKADLPEYEFEHPITDFKRYALKRKAEAATAADEDLKPILKDNE